MAAKQQKGEKRKVGRPTDYNKTIANRICMGLVEGRSLRDICKDDNMPARGTVYRWLFENVEFQDLYARAREIGLYAFAEDTIDIADDGVNDWMEKLDKEGEVIGWQLNGEHVQRSRLRVDTRKWFMERLAPKKYGGKVDVNHGLQEGNPITELVRSISGNTLGPQTDDDS